MKEKLYVILDFILNHADPKELQAIQEAVKRRTTQFKSNKGTGNMPQRMAKNLENQMSIPMDGIRQSIRDFVVRMIKNQVPDIAPEHLEILLNEWVPDPHKAKSSTASKFPKDVLFTMVNQFISFSLNKMPNHEEENLRREMPNWPELYWAKFPQQIQSLISTFLKGSMGEKEFWQALEQYV